MGRSPNHMTLVTLVDPIPNGVDVRRVVEREAMREVVRADLCITRVCPYFILCNHLSWNEMEISLLSHDYFFCVLHNL